ncbi:MAG: serine hydrolase, partial [Comamonadaceae bacterium]
VARRGTQRAGARKSVELPRRRAAKPWAQLVRERITAPLGMVDTVQLLGDKAPRLAPAFAGERSTPPWEFDAFSGAGALRSTPRDLLLFGRAIAAGRDGPLGAAAVRLVTPQARFDGDIGLGMFVAGPPSRRSFSHTGGTGGFTSYLLIAPDTQEVMVLLASNNSSSTRLYRIGGEVLANRYPATARPAPVDPAVLADYAGVYRENKANAYTFMVRDGVLHSRGTNQPYTPLIPAGRDTFLRRATAQAEFTREAGKVVAVTWLSRGAVRTARRTEATAQQPMPQAQLLAYTGRFRSPHFTYTVRAEDGQLSIQRGESQPFLVYPASGKPDWFVYEAVDAEAQFERYRGGGVRALVIHDKGAFRAQRID